MIQRRIRLDHIIADTDFLGFLREGIISKINEYPFSKRTKDVLKKNLDLLNKRYKTDLKVSNYKKAIGRLLEVSMKGSLLSVKLSEKSKYYKTVKSIELGSYMVKKISIIGEIIAMLIPLVEKLYTDYELVVAKLAYLQENESLKYRLLMKHSLYQIHLKLSNRVKLL